LQNKPLNELLNIGTKERFEINLFLDLRKSNHMKCHFGSEIQNIIKIPEFEVDEGLISVFTLKSKVLFYQIFATLAENHCSYKSVVVKRLALILFEIK